MFETLNYEDIAFDGKTLDLTLEPGCYRLITSMRMPNGDQHAAYRVFELKAGEAKEIYLETVKKGLDELLEHIELPEITLEDLDGKAHTLNDLTKDGPILLAFLGTGEEPTEHVLNELIEIAEKWNAKDAAMASRAPHESRPGKHDFPESLRSNPQHVPLHRPIRRRPGDRRKNGNRCRKTPTADPRIAGKHRRTRLCRI